MLHALFEGPGRIAVHERTKPTPAPGDVVVRIARCGICGSDLHFFHSASSRVICPGHEACGTVEAIGQGVTRVREGDRVAIEPLRMCGECKYCRSGQGQLCTRLKILGVMEHGCLAECTVTPAQALYVLPDSLDFDCAALTEPAAVAVHAAKLGNVGPNSRVLILGAGSIGLVTAAVLQHLGVASVAITARHPHQAALANALGCDVVLDPSDLASLDTSPDVVVETVGGEARTLLHAVRAVAPGGTVVMVGLFEKNPPFDPMAMLVKEVRMVASNVYGSDGQRRDFEVALDLLSERGVELAQMVTHTFPLAEIQTAFETAADKSSGAIKVLIEP